MANMAELEMLRARNDELSAMLPTQLREVRREAEALQEKVLAEAAMEIQRTASRAESERRRASLAERMLTQEREASRETTARAALAARELAKGDLEVRLVDGLRDVRAQHAATTRALQRQYDDLEARSKAEVAQLRVTVAQRDREMVQLEAQFRDALAKERGEAAARMEAQRSEIDARTRQYIHAGKARNESAHACTAEVMADNNALRRRLVALELQIESTKTLAHEEVARTRASADAACQRLASQLSLMQQQRDDAHSSILLRSPAGWANDQAIFARQQEELRAARRANLALREAMVKEERAMQIPAIVNVVEELNAARGESRRLSNLASDSATRNARGVLEASMAGLAVADATRASAESQ